MSQEESPAAPKSGLSPLAITSMLLLAAAVGVIGWLALGAGDYQDRFGRTKPVVTLSLPSAGGGGAETGAPAQPVEPDAPLTAGGGADVGAREPAERAEVPEPKPKTPAAKATPPEKVETATPEPPEPAKTPPRPAAPEAKAKPNSKASATAETPVKVEALEKAGVETAVPRPPKALSNIITRLSALKPAPDPRLTEKSGLGLLPVIGDDGRQPWRVYARGFDETDQRPRIALVIAGLGLSEASTQAAIQRLPGAVTLAFAPYAKTLDRWIPLARAAGHEVLLTLPMEPDNFPADDPGPHALLTSLAAAENLKRLRWVLSRTSGYVGVINGMGSRFTTSSRHLDPVLGELKRRGLMFVDSGTSLRSVAAKMATRIGLARAINNRFIDVKASREAIDRRLSELERIARTSGHALGVGTPYPVTFERVGRWLRGFEKKGLVLAPVSAVANKQPD